MADHGYKPEQKTCNSEDVMTDDEVVRTDDEEVMTDDEEVRTDDTNEKQTVRRRIRSSSSSSKTGAEKTLFKEHLSKSQSNLTRGDPISRITNPASNKTFDQFKKEDDQKKITSSPPIPKSIHRDIQRSRLVKVIVLFIGVLFIGVMYMIFTSLSNTSASEVVEAESSWKHRQRNFLTNIINLKKRLPNQGRETWIQIISAVNSTLGYEEPKQPSVVLLLQPPEISRQFASCLARKLAAAVNEAFSETKTDIKELDPIYFSDKPTVTSIHDDLKTYLKAGKAIIAYDIDQIVREDHLLVFHSFCDNYLAHDKRATFFNVITVPTNVYKDFQWEHTNGAAISIEILNAAWKDALTPDKRPALISRVVVSVVLLKRGDSCK